MKKIIYLYGIYKLCVGIHQTFTNMPEILESIKETIDKIDKMDELPKNEHEKKAEILNIRKTKNQIGFRIN